LKVIGGTDENQAVDTYLSAVTGVVMHAFMSRCRLWWITCAFGRNPLLRWTDRIEACVIVFAIVVALAATPVCALAGAGVYRSHHQLYAAQSRVRQPVTATVIETGPPPHTPHATRAVVLATWAVGADSARTGEVLPGHTGWVSTDRAAKAGDRIEIWVNAVGAPTAPPTPPSQATFDAVGYGAGIWLIATLGLMAAVGMVRSPLNRIRHVQWEREIKGFANGGTSNRPH
jgi:hypothetical protein